MGIRKALDDSFVLLAQHPISSHNKDLGTWATATVQGANSYAMLANDKISIEFPPDPENTIEIATSTAASPAGFTSQYYDGEAYANTANPPAITITARQLTGI